MIARTPMIDIATQLAKGRDLENKVAPVVVQPSDKGSLQSEVVELSTSGLGRGKIQQWTGYNLTLAKAGTAPGARFELLVDGRVHTIAPGMTIPGHFTTPTLRRLATSAKAGPAVFVWNTAPGRGYEEPAQLVGPPCGPVDLLGTFNSLTASQSVSWAVDGTGFVRLAESTAPTIGSTAAFDASGWRRLRLIVALQDPAGAGGSGINVNSVDILPWAGLLTQTALERANATGDYASWIQPQFMPQVDQIISIDNSYNGSQAYLVTRVLEIAPFFGLLAFSAENVLPAPATGLLIAVQGIE